MAKWSGSMFFGQQFDVKDFPVIGALVVLEALLSADNALVLAIMVRHLPREQQRRALMYGMGGAFVLRSLAIVFATKIIQFWWLQLIGALYLLFLPFKHFLDHAKGKEVKAKKAGFWATVAYIEMVDLAFALDSVIVAVAIVDTVRHPEKVWVVAAGAIIGIIILRFAAGFFIRLLEKYPILDHVAYLLVGWAGVKLTLISGHSFERWLVARGGTMPFHVPEMPTWLFWLGMAIISIGGTVYAVRNARVLTPEEKEQSEVVKDAAALDATSSDSPEPRSETPSQ